MENKKVVTDDFGRLEAFRRHFSSEIASIVAEEREVVARQAMKLERLEDENEQLRDRISRAKRHMICIGGPLNDNKLGYSREQMATFFRIKEELDG
jgi:nucleoside-triphosphatase THEP1